MTTAKSKNARKRKVVITLKITSDGLSKLSPETKQLLRDVIGRVFKETN